MRFVLIDDSEIQRSKDNNKLVMKTVPVTVRNTNDEFIYEKLRLYLTGYNRSALSKEDILKNFNHSTSSVDFKTASYYEFMFSDGETIIIPDKLFSVMNIDDIMNRFKTKML